MRLAHHLVAPYITPVPRRQAAINRLAVHLRQQDVCNGADHSLPRALQQTGKPPQKPALPQANRVVDIGEGEEFNSQLRRRSPGPQLPVLVMKNFEQSFTHSDPRLAWDDLLQIAKPA